MDASSLFFVLIIWPVSIVLSIIFLFWVIAYFSLTDRWLRNKIIKKRFAWLPVEIEGQSLWLKSYFELREVGAFSLGGSSQVDVSHNGRFICFSNRGQGKTSVYYDSIGLFLSLSGLKKILRDEGLFENKYQKAVEDRKRIETNREIFKKMGWEKFLK